MDPSLVQALAAQAAAAEARLAKIEATIAAGSGLPPATVADLQELRELLLQAKAESEQLRAERDEAVARADAAQAEVAKLNYRVQHLVRAVRAGDEKLAASSS